MKSSHYRNRLVILALACAIVALADIGAPASLLARGTQGGGRLIVQRTSNFGTRMYLNLEVDGVQVASLGLAQHYEGVLSPGPHTLTVIGLPNQFHQSPTKVQVNVESGQTYAFIGAWDSDRVVLVKNGG
jgi:hypothetical protein